MFTLLFWLTMHPLPSFPPGLKFGTGFSQRRSKGIEVIVVTSILLADPEEAAGFLVAIQVLWFFVLPFQITNLSTHWTMYTIVDVHSVFHILKICWHDWNRKHHTPNRTSAVLTIKRMGHLIINQPKLTQLPHCKARSPGNHASAGDGYRARHKGSSPATKRHIWPWVVSHNEASPGPGFGRWAI